MGESPESQINPNQVRFFPKLIKTPKVFREQLSFDVTAIKIMKIQNHSNSSYLKNPKYKKIVNDLMFFMKNVLAKLASISNYDSTFASLSFVLPFGGKACKPPSHTRQSIILELSEVMRKSPAVDHKHLNLPQRLFWNRLCRIQWSSDVFSLLIRNRLNGS